MLDFFALRITPSARVAGAGGTAARGGRRYLGVAAALRREQPLPWAAAEVRRTAKLAGNLRRSPAPTPKGKP